MDKLQNISINSQQLSSLEGVQIALIKNWVHILLQLGTGSFQNQNQNVLRPYGTSDRLSAGCQVYCRKHPATSKLHEVCISMEHLSSTYEW
jgi:hypothetical protein